MAPRMQNRPGFTMIEMAIVAGVIALLAAVALPNINFRGFEMDANTRNLQNQILASQTISVQNNKYVLLTFVYCNSQFRIVVDSNKNKGYDSGERRYWKTLSEGAKFVIPPSTIDGYSPYYVTGPGIIGYNNVAATNGKTCSTSPSVWLYPTGSTSGDVVVYLGPASTNPRKQDYRAVQMYGATGKIHVWRMQSDGTWKQSDMQ